NGECLHTLGIGDSVNSVAFSHDSARLASASYDKTIKIWDASSGECLRTLEGHGSSVNSVAFSHDSAGLASASDDKTVKIWNASSGECLHTLGIGDSVNSVAFSHDSARLAPASDDKTVKIWDACSGECLHTLEGHGSSVRSVAFSHDSAWLASASDDKSIKIWNTLACTIGFRFLHATKFLPHKPPAGAWLGLYFISLASSRASLQPQVTVPKAWFSPPVAQSSRQPFSSHYTRRQT
ncbi:WD40 repeat-like protein, partial [Zopfia rhizophila CBS 207.26]